MSGKAAETQQKNRRKDAKPTQTRATAVSSPNMLGNVLQQAALAPGRVTPTEAVYLQRTIGNQALGQMAGAGSSERTADLAQSSLQSILHHSADVANGAVSLMQRQEEEEEIQAKVDDPLAGGPIAPHNDSTFTNKHPPLQIKVNQMPPGSHLQPARTKFGRFMADAGFFLAGLPVLGIGGLAGLAGSEFAAQSTFGSGHDRRQINTPTDQLDITNNKSYVANDIAIRGGGFGSKYVLRGRRYDPKPHLAAGPGQGKAVILFSGSGGPNENQLEPVADFYAKQGTTAFAVNYRGYGGSRDKGALGGEKNPWLSEDGLYHDARRIYKYVNQTGGFAPGDITLHGFSLGGAVASNLAKKLAKKGVQLGGLVLHSSIETAYKAAYAEGEEMGGKAVGVLGGLGSKLAAGDFSTSAHLKKLVERDPDLPVHFMSGGYGDQLALDQTGLTGIGGLNNSSSHQAGGDHLTTSSHLQGNENFLATLLQQGRNRQQGQEEAVPAVL